MINLINTVLALFIMAALAVAGVNWITSGYGLNAWLSFPLAILFACIAIWQIQLFVKSEYAKGYGE